MQRFPPPPFPQVFPFYMNSECGLVLHFLLSGAQYLEHRGNLPQCGTKRLALNLWAVLSKFGFGNKFISWVKLLYAAPQARVFTNACLLESFPLGRGTRQGCPVCWPVRPGYRTSGRPY